MLTFSPLELKTGLSGGRLCGIGTILGGSYARVGGPTAPACGAMDVRDSMLVIRRDFFAIAPNGCHCG